MKKKPFVIFGLMLLLLAVVIPAWAFWSNADPSQGREEVPANLENGQSLFVDNCGSCHKLYAAGTYGDFGPDLDQKLSAAGTPTTPEGIDGVKAQVLSAIEQGADDPTVSGRMPAGIVAGVEAEEIAEFVAATAGRG